MVFDEFLVQGYGLSFNAEPATVRHGVTAIGDQVHEYLLYLPTISQNGRWFP